MSVRRPPRLRAFPSEDVAFRRFVADAIAELLANGGSGADGDLLPEDLAVRLRERYPSAVVRPRDALADPGDGQLVWYVYRFGAVMPGRRWWDEPGHAWAILDDDRRFVEVSTSLAEIVEVTRDDLLGCQVEAFSNATDVSVRDDVIALWAQLLEQGELHGTLRFRRLDGSPREIEYHVTRETAGPNRHLATVREIDPAAVPPSPTDVVVGG